MQRTRAIPVTWLSSGLCLNRPKGWIPIIIRTLAKNRWSGRGFCGEVYRFDCWLVFSYSYVYLTLKLICSRLSVLTSHMHVFVSQRIMFYSYREREHIYKFGVSVVFLATHSGLTRWQTFQDDERTQWVYMHNCYQFFIPVCIVSIWIY